jgi:hypothetical protein
MSENMLSTSTANRKPKTAEEMYFLLFLMSKRELLLKRWGEKFT